MTDLEAYQFVLLRRPADAPGYSDEVLDRLQAEHLAFYAALRADGRVLTNGPFSEQGDDRMRGLVFYRLGTLQAARDLAVTDPLVVAGRLEVEAMTYLCPPGTMVLPGLPVTVDD